jgi:hypothetical protein
VNSSDLSQSSEVLGFNLSIRDEGRHRDNCIRLI